MAGMDRELRQLRRFEHIRDAKNIVSGYEAAKADAVTKIRSAEEKVEKARRKSDNLGKSGSEAINAKDARIADKLYN